MNVDARRSKKECGPLLPHHGRPVANVIARVPWESAQEEVMERADGVCAFFPRGSGNGVAARSADARGVEARALMICVDQRSSVGQ